LARQSNDQILIVGLKGVYGNLISSNMSAGGAMMDDLPSLLFVIVQTNRCHKPFAAVRPVAGFNVDMLGP